MKNVDRLSALVFEQANQSWGTVTAAALPGAFINLEGYFWDRIKKAYISETTGKSVPESVIRHAVENANSKFVAQNIERLTDNLISGKIDLPTWQQKMALELKHGHVANMSVGKGGRSAVTFSDWGKAGSRLKFQYKRLNLFAQAIKAEQLTANQIKARANMYSRSVRTSYFDGLTRANITAGYNEERRITTSEKPCSICEGLAGENWKPIGSLPEPGSACEGFTNCKCYKQYRKVVQKKPWWKFWQR